METGNNLYRENLMKKDFLEVGADVKNNCRLTVEDRRNRTVWKTSLPPFSVSIWSVGEERQFKVTTGEERCRTEIKQRGGVLTADHRWDNYGIALTVEYRILNDYMEVRIPYRRLREREHYLYRLMNIDVLPDLSGVSSANSGYFLLPNFCGVLCRFGGKTESVENRSFVYMHQSQWEQYSNVPLFGVKKDDSGFLGLITGGDYDAEVVTVLNGGNKKHFIYPTLHFRYSKTDVIDDTDRSVRYYFLAGGDADYVSMAKKYRRYLLEEKGAVPFKERVKREPVLAYELGATTVKIFHAMKSRRPEGNGRLAVFTTFGETKKIVSDLVRAGIDRVSYQLTGWCPGGHDGMCPTRLPMEERLGGEKEFADMRKHIIASGHKISFHDNYADAYRISPDWKEEDVMLDREGEPIRGGIWGGGYAHIICPYRGIDILKKGLVRVKRDLKPNGLYYLDAMPVPLRICYNRKHSHPHTRRAHAEGMINIWKEAKKILGLPVGTENITGYSIGVSDYSATIVSNIPHRPFLSQSPLIKHFVDDLVPFLHIVAHGLVKYHLCDITNMESVFGSRKKGLLKSIEYGALPRFEIQYRDKFIRDKGYLHFGDYRRLISDAARHHNVLCRELGYLQTEFIDTHKQVDKERFVTSYEDGTSIEVDYRNKDYRVNRK
jgi:hypothetical protein